MIFLGCVEILGLLLQVQQWSNLVFEIFFVDFLPFLRRLMPNMVDRVLALPKITRSIDSSENALLLLLPILVSALVGSLLTL